MSRRRLSWFIMISMVLSLLISMPLVTSAEEAPLSASAVSIKGYPNLAQKLSGLYTFNEGGSHLPELNSTFRWLRSTDFDSLIPIGSSYSTYGNTDFERVLWTNFNSDGVGYNPISGPQFTLTKSTIISKMWTYHYNNGSGATPGTISLKDQNGDIYGPWDATGLWSNFYWQIDPNVLLPAGSYTVIDSDPSTWAQNNESLNCGMTHIFSRLEFEPIPDANRIDYILTELDLDHFVKFEVTVSDQESHLGTAEESPAIGPVSNLPTIINIKTTNLTLEPRFSADSFNYSANASHSILSTNIQVMTNEENPSIRIDGQLCTSKEVDLKVGVNIFTVQRFSVDNETVDTYSLTITREPVPVIETTSPSPEPSTQPSAMPSPEPTTSSTPEPIVTPSAEPLASPNPSIEPTIMPTPQPTLTPEPVVNETDHDTYVIVTLPDPLIISTPPPIENLTQIDTVLTPTILEVQVPLATLPKTGELPASLFYSSGALIAALGGLLRKRSK